MKPQSTIAISTVAADIPVEPKRRRKSPWKSPLGEDHEPSISLELFDSFCRVWDEADFTACGDSYPYDRSIADMPHFAEVFKFIAEQYAANRSNPLGAFLRRAVVAMETAMAKRNGSYVYFARAGSRVKIGWSRQVASRVAQLQTGNAAPIELLGVMPGARSTERELHERFAATRVSGEWFEATPELLDYIRSVGS